jgi:hypothetical protein
MVRAARIACSVMICAKCDRERRHHGEHQRALQHHAERDQDEDRQQRRDHDRHVSLLSCA